MRTRRREGRRPSAAERPPAASASTDEHEIVAAAQQAAEEADVEALQKGRAPETRVGGRHAGRGPGPTWKEVAFLVLAVPGTIMDSAFLLERVLYGPAVADLHPLLGGLVDWFDQQLAAAPDWVEPAAMAGVFLMALAGVPGMVAIAIALPLGVFYLCRSVGGASSVTPLLFLALAGALVALALHLQP